MQLHSVTSFISFHLNRLNSKVFVVAAATGLRGVGEMVSFLLNRKGSNGPRGAPLVDRLSSYQVSHVRAFIFVPSRSRWVARLAQFS